MSQDTGLFSVRRPRETLGGLNFNSAIPQPNSAVLKRSNSISNIKDPLLLTAPHTSHHARSVSSSRMSLAPNRPQQPSFQRSSSGNNNNFPDLTGRPSTVQRSSSGLFGGGNSGGSAIARTSYAPGSAVTPRVQQPPSSMMSASQSLQRRSSVYSRPSTTAGPMGQQSFFVQAPIPATAPRDPRPLKTGSYQAKMGQEMLDYLTQHNFELEMKHTLSQNVFKSPTQKDFNFVFQWLYHRIDPAYRFQKNIDAEVPAILKQLRYPFEKNITKSQISAVGGQNWSALLGMLHWMMQLAQMLDRYETGEYDDACAEAGIDVSGDRIIFRFLSGAYRDWLQVDDGDDENDDGADQLLIPHIQAMAAEFERGNQRYSEEMKILEAEHASLSKQIAEAEKGIPDVAKLEEHFKILQDDIRKFEEYNASIEGKVAKYESKIKFLTDELERTETELKEAEQEKLNLQESVDRQGITIQDIDRMNSERERLQKGVEATSSRLDETKRKSQEKESEANRMLEELERAAEKYNSLCYQIGLIPSTATNAKGQTFELQLPSSLISPHFSSSQLKPSLQYSTANSDDRLLASSGTGYHINDILSLSSGGGGGGSGSRSGSGSGSGSLDLRGRVKNQFVGLRKEINERRTVALDVDVKNHELLDSIKEAIDDKRSEVEALEHRVRAAEEEFEKTKEITSTQKSSLDLQIEKTEKELSLLRASLSESIHLIEQRELNTNIEYENLTLQISALRTSLHAQIETILQESVKFKMHVQRSLEDYEGFVVEEVEAELEDEGDEEDEELGEGEGEVGGVGGCGDGEGDGYVLV